MSVTRINEFQAAGEQTQRLQSFLTSVVAGIEASDGCLSCRLLRDREDETRFVILEVPGVEAHEASVEDISPDELREIMRMLASPPQGRYLVDTTTT